MTSVNYIIDTSSECLEKKVGDSELICRIRSHV